MKTSNDIQLLSSEEQNFLSTFSALPEIEISINTIFFIYNIDENQKIKYFDLIHDLAIKNWLKYNKEHYFLEKENRNLIKLIIPADVENSENLLKKLAEEFLSFKKEETNEKLKLAFFAESFILNVEGVSNKLSVFANNLASFYDFIGENEKAIKFLFRAINIQSLLDNSNSEISFYYNNLAILYLKTGNIDKSINCGFQSVKYLEENSYKNYEVMATTYSIISSAYDKKRDFKNALNYNLKAIEIAENQLKNKFDLLTDYYHDAAINFYHLKNYKNANFYIEKALLNYNKSDINQDSYYKKMLSYKTVFSLHFKLSKNLKKYSKILVIIILILLFALISYSYFIK